MIHQNKRMDLILPEESLHRSSLASFWDRYRALFPEHEIFGIISREDLKYTVPIKLHGDEGRSALTLTVNNLTAATLWFDV